MKCHKFNNIIIIIIATTTCSREWYLQNYVDCTAEQYRAQVMGILMMQHKFEELVLAEMEAKAAEL